ncbi:MAG: hypothetical protein IPL96_10655 [Holophagaceae bacterium]|nr:hypothetical protein [Holophagaceae bacterium]
MEASTEVQGTAAVLKKFVQEFWIHAAILLVFVWLLRPRKSILGDELTGDSVSLRTHGGMRVLAAGVGVLGAFFLLISLALFQDPEGINWATALPCTLISLGMLVWVWKAFSFRIEAGLAGIRYTAAFHKVIAEWSDVESVAWAPRSSAHVVKTRLGSIPVASNLEKVPLLMKMIERHRPDLFKGATVNPIIPAKD